MLLVQSITVGVMGRGLRSRCGPRRYAGDVFAARYGCSLGYLLPRDVIGFRLPTPPGPVGAGGRGGIVGNRRLSAAVLLSVLSVVETRGIGEDGTSVRGYKEGRGG